jgi:hypothetical protein
VVVVSIKSELTKLGPLIGLDFGVLKRLSRAPCDAPVRRPSEPNALGHFGRGVCDW